MWEMVLDDINIRCQFSSVYEFNSIPTGFRGRIERLDRKVLSFFWKIRLNQLLLLQKQQTYQRSIYESLDKEIGRMREKKYM